MAPCAGACFLAFLVRGLCSRSARLQSRLPQREAAVRQRTLCGIRGGRLGSTALL